MVSSLINWLFRRHTVSYKLHHIERLIAEKKYMEASIAVYLALQKFPDHPELLTLKAQAEKEMAHYIYNQEF
ncbi:hypothetical protein Pam2_148 [Pseudanabaena phage Pam2]|nr:hypothetical protein Pam2_148 [Pseudanabaena phage Pam2]